MHIRLIAIGTKMPAWVDEGYQEYAKRMPPECALKLVEIPAEKRTKNSDIKKILYTEGQKILDAIPKGEPFIALDINGRKWDTVQFAEELKQWKTCGHNIHLVIGGPEGLSPECIEKASRRWSLSPLTFPHPLVRIILAEQLYRAWSLLTHRPYHR